MATLARDAVRILIFPNENVHNGQPAPRRFVDQLTPFNRQQAVSGQGAGSDGFSDLNKFGVVLAY